MECNCADLKLNKSDPGDIRAAINSGKALCLLAELDCRPELQSKGETPNLQVRAKPICASRQASEQGIEIRNAKNPLCESYAKSC